MEKDDDAVPRTDKPLHGPRKGPWSPLLVTLLVMGVVAAIYFFGMWVGVGSE